MGAGNLYQTNYTNENCHSYNFKEDQPNHIHILHILKSNPSPSLQICFLEILHRIHNETVLSL